MSKKDIADAILRHLLEHPDARDTVSGIMEWWIRADLVGAGEQEIQSVLDELCSSNILQKKITASGDPLYALNQKK